MKVEEREGRSKNDVGRRTKGNELVRFMTRFERGVAWRRRKELVSRDGVTPRFTGVHRVFAFTCEQRNPEKRERRRKGSRKTRVNGPHSTAYKLQIRQAR